MDTEVKRTPAYLYDALAPLGEDVQVGSESSLPSSWPLGIGQRTMSETLTSLSVSAVTAGTLEDFRRRFGSTSKSGIGKLGNDLTSSDGESEDFETKMSGKIIEVEGFQASGPSLTSNDGNEELGFLSLDFDETTMGVDVVMAEEKVLFSGIMSSAPRGAPPWARAEVSHHPWIRSPFLRLHQEIVDFCDFVAPTQEEQQLRSAAVQRVGEVVKSIWPSCQVKVFGSFATGLFLPSSDCDVVVLESGCQVPQDGLKAIAKALNRKSLVKKLQVIGKARVPIVKFVETESNIAFDISFDVRNGPDAADFIKDAMEALPPLRPLCLVLKIFLQQRELNEVYTGGIGSYALLVMLLTHLQMHPSRRSTANRDEPCSLEGNLGVLLVDFFYFYGNALNVRDVGISCRNGGRFYCKGSRGFGDNGRPYLLSVEDPQSPENDIGKNSYNVSKVRSAFVLAHRLLTRLEVENVPARLGLLGRIVRMDKELAKRKSVLRPVPCRLNSMKDIPSKVSVIGGSYSALLTSEPEALVPGGGSGGRRRSYNDNDFPRGGGPDTDRTLFRKRKHSKERGQGPHRSYLLHKRRRNDLVLGCNRSSPGKGERSRHERDSFGPNTPGSPLNVPSHFGGQYRGERFELSYLPVVYGTVNSSERRGTAGDDGTFSERVICRSEKVWRKHSGPRKESHEEGEIVPTDYIASFGVGKDLQELVPGNGRNERTRWFDEGGPRKNPKVRSVRRA